MEYLKNVKELELLGFSILDKLYSNDEVSQIVTCIEKADQAQDSFTKTKDLFAIRQLVKTVPELKVVLFNEKLKRLIAQFSDETYFLTKSIYFDKPQESNWFVAYHQDLSISVDRKCLLDGYTNWTFKKGQYGVQPPAQILKDTITVRIHLDDTNQYNGALKVIPKTHLKGIIRLNEKKVKLENHQICEVKKGGAMLMKPLTLHASSRTTNGMQRRVIHLEFNKHDIKEPLNWLEYCQVVQ